MWKALLVSMLLFAAAISLAEQKVPVQEGMITDVAGVLSDADRNSIETGMNALERATGANLQILVVQGLHGESLGKYASRVDRAWHPEENVVSKDMLLVVSTSDRGADLVVGDGLKRLIPESKARAIVDEAMLQDLRSGQLAPALSSGVALVSKVIEEDRVDDVAPPMHAMFGRPTSSGEMSSYFLLMGGLAGAVLALAWFGMRRDLSEYFRSRRNRHAAGR